MKFSQVNSLNFAVIAAFSAITLFVFSTATVAQETGSETEGSASKPAATKATDKKTETDIKKLHEQFRQQMKGAKMIGHFTMAGEQSDKRRPEEYHILSANKLEEGDQWLSLIHI